ncbi:MAG: ABC transporter permease subunit [Eubacteriales bacterium]|nr:ABC transporter permease subunit [Eubacteriales bacterium]
MTTQAPYLCPKTRILSRRRLKMDYPLYLMLAMPVLLLFVYNYVAMGGIVIAFQKYLPAKGITGSKWIGLKNFETLFTMPGFIRALSNTLTLSLWKIILGIVVPVGFTLMLNEIKSSGVKRVVQTLIYLPHFISWVLLASIFTKLLSGSGIVNQFIKLLGGTPIMFLGDNHWFPFTIIATYVWKEFGYGTIVYLAAISGVNEELYEAASIDGAGHFQQMLHVTLPTILPVIILMTALSVGNILNAGFDQVYNMYNNVVLESGDIIDTLVYRTGFDSGNFGLSTATGLFKSVVSCVLVIASYRIAYKTSGYHIF